MQEMYDRAHPPNGRTAKRCRRSLFVEGPVYFEIFLSGMERQEYEARTREHEPANGKDCRLCWPEESLIYRGKVAIAPDLTPFFPYHMLLKPVITECIDSTFVTVLPNVRQGFVRKEHLDCRPAFSFEDIAVMGYLVREEDEYIISQSMAGSGASIPEHIHAHAFLKSQTDFPLLNRSCFTRLPRTDNIWVNTHHTYGILIRDEPEVIAEIFVEIRNKLGLSSNHYFKTDDAFGGLIGLYVPRVKQVPSVPSIAQADWKFGAFEVLGLYDAKTAELYQTLKTEELCRATCSVTLQDKESRAVIEDICRAVIAGRR